MKKLKKLVLTEGETIGHSIFFQTMLMFSSTKYTNTYATPN
jgi:hypothetical protein